MSLHYQIYGQGQPIIILHGLFGSADNWRGIAQQLAKHGFQIITVDLANHGRSYHTSDVSFQAMAADLKTLIDQLQLVSPHIIGHSVGGKVAMAFSQLYPAVLKKLVVIDIAPKAYSDQHSVIFDALLNIELSDYSSRTQVNQALAKTIPDISVRQFLLMNLEAKEQQLRWRINLNDLATHYENLLVAVCINSDIEIPSCFIRGGKSDYILDSDIGFINSIFRNNTIITIEEAGHWVQADAPKLFLTHVVEFLNHD